VNLDLFHINGSSSSINSHLVTVTSRVLSIGGRELPELGPILSQQASLGKVGGITTRGENDRTILLLGLTFIVEFDTDDGFTFLDELGHGSLFENLDAVGDLDRQIFETLQLSIGDDHTGELGTTAVGALLRVATETRDFGEVEVELGLEPVDGRSRVACEDADEVVACEILCGLLGVVEEDLGRVLNAKGVLGVCAGTVDTTV
jgi:hypothetical protein